MKNIGYALITGVNYHYINPVTILLKEEFEDTKGITRIRKSTDRQHNGQKKIINNDLKTLHSAYVTLNTNNLFQSEQDYNIINYKQTMYTIAF